MIKIYVREKYCSRLEFKVEGKNQIEAEEALEVVVKNKWFSTNSYVKFNWLVAGELEIVYADYDFEEKKFNDRTMKLVLIYEEIK